MDIFNAYLNEDLKEEIYMKIPEDLTSPLGYKDCVLQIRKSLYGLKQSGQEWNRKITGFLHLIGFKSISGDSCIFVNHSTHVIIGLYVDDLLIFFKHKAAISKLKWLLKREYTIKNMGPIKYILGIRIRQNQARKLIILD